MPRHCERDLDWLLVIATSICNGHPSGANWACCLRTCTVTSINALAETPLLADVAELIVREMITSATIDPAAVAHEAAEEQLGLHQPAHAEPLTAENALFW